MALALVQSIDGAGPGAATAVATFASNVTAGNKIYAIGGPYKNGGVPTETVTGVTDSQGNTYTLVRGPDDDTVHTRGYIYVATAGSTGACAVTLTCSGIPAAGGCIVGIFEVSGTGVTVEDSQAGNGSTSGVVTGPTLTTAGTALGIAFQFSFATTNSSNNNAWAGSVTANGDGVASKALTGGAAVVNAFNVTASVADHWFIEALAVKEASAVVPGATDIGRTRTGPPRRPPFAPSELARPSALATITGTVNVTEGGDAITAAGSVSQPGTVAASPHFGGPPRRQPFTSGPLGQLRGGLATITGTVNVTESADTISATGAVAQQGTQISRSSGPPRRPPFRSSPLSKSTSSAPAIAVDASGRYLTRNGQPFPLLTRASWFATANATNLSEWQSYIDDSATKGYTGVLLQAIVTPSTHFPTLTTAPATQGGATPFLTCVSSSHTGTTNFDEYATQTAYWSWVDSLVDYAASKGVIVVLYAAYISQWGAGTANEGWGYALAEAHNTASGYAAVASYGDFLARRYLVARSNVILATWGDTDDAHITTDEKGAQQALWAAVRAVVPSAIYGGETGAPDGLLTDQSATGWGTPITPLLNYAYFDGAGSNGRPEVTGQRAWLVSGPRPAYAAEGPYYGVSGVTTEAARRSRWRAWLGGMLAGVNQGTSGIWDWTTGGGVLSHLSDTTETQHAAGFLSLVRSLPWWNLAPVLDGPNGTNNLISTPIGAWDTNTYVTSAQTAAADLAVCYISSTGTGTQSVGVSLAQMTGLSTVRARWFDPTSGAYTTDGTYSPSGTHTFVTPGTNAEGTANDWVLVLDAPTPSTGNASVTEGADTTTATGTLAIAGTSSVTEGADTTSASGALAIAGTSSTTEGADSATATGSIPATGTSSTSEGADTVTAAGALTATGTSSVTEGADTTSAAGALTVTGTSSTTEGADTISATGTNSPGNHGDASVTEGADTISGAGTVAIAGTSSTAEGADTLSATGTAPGGPVTGAASVTEGADGLSATGTVRIAGTATVTEGADTLTSASAPVPTNASLTYADASTTSATLTATDATQIVASLTWEPL